VEEKLRAMEILWEDLCRDEKNLPMPQWHKDLLDHRQKLIRAGKARFANWETAKKRISNQAGEN